jgi:hypothetical protein
LFGLQGWKAALQLLASARLDSPRHANTVVLRTRPSFFTACLRVTDWAKPLASSSNLLFILFPFVPYLLCLATAQCGAAASFSGTDMAPETRSKGDITEFANAMSATAIIGTFAATARRQACACASPAPTCQPEAGQRQAGKADAEFLQCVPACCRLSQSPGQLIEFVIHTFPFVLFLFGVLF